MDGRDERHKARMQRKKAVVDAKIAEAQDEYGLLLVHSGNGKGKSSSAFGMVARALGHGIKVGVVQFIKGAASTGEENFLRRFPEEVRYHVMGEGFTWETQDRQRDIAKAQEAWAVARELLADESIGLVVLDELNIALKRLSGAGAGIGRYRVAANAAARGGHRSRSTARADRGGGHRHRNEPGQACVQGGREGAEGRGILMPVLTGRVGWMTPFSSTARVVGGWVKRHPPYARPRKRRWMSLFTSTMTRLALRGRDE